jgi:hypothetical protein
MSMISLTVGHESPATFARIITPSARVSIIMFSAIATGMLAIAAIDALASSNFPASANDATWDSSSRPSSYSDLMRAWAISVFLVIVEVAERARRVASLTAVGTRAACCGLAASSRCCTVSDAFASSFK